MTVYGCMNNDGPQRPVDLSARLHELTGIFRYTVTNSNTVIVSLRTDDGFQSYGINPAGHSTEPVLTEGDHEACMIAHDALVFAWGGRKHGDTLHV